MTKVLIIDDEENIRFSFATILTEAGYDVITAADIIDVKAIIAANQFEVAVVDRILGSNNGMQIIKHINEAQPNCTNILISAFPNFKSASEGYQHRLFAYLQKPVKKDELLEIVKKAGQNSEKRLKSSIYEQQLIQSQKMATMGMLSSGIVHEFNNLLMVINGIAELSCLDSPENNPFFKNMKEIQKVSIQGEKLTGQLRSYIKLSCGKPEHIRIQSLMEEALAILRITVPKTITIQEKTGHGNDIVLVYPTQIQQVIINIGINAMQAMDQSPGTLKVNLDRLQLASNSMASLGLKKPDCVKISMEDSGCGMDEKILKQIFEPFFSAGPKGVGTGVGLCISKMIIKNHGGAITAKSKMGKGSTFQVYLPVI